MENKQLRAARGLPVGMPETAERRSAKAASSLEALPVLAGTRLCLELALGGGALPSRTLTDVVCRDPVAVLRLYLLAAEAGNGLAGAPEGLEDCLACVGRDDFLRALCQPIPGSRREQTVCLAFAQHAFTIACCTRTVAGALGLNGEHAFLIGLLHEIGFLPQQLAQVQEGEQSPVAQAGPAWAAVPAAALARRYRLPPFLCCALEDVHGGNDASLWTAAVRAAHDLAGGSEGPMVCDSPGKAG